MYYQINLKCYNELLIASTLTCKHHDLSANIASMTWYKYVMKIKTKDISVTVRI